MVPAILSSHKGGLSKGTYLVAHCIASFVSSLLVGVSANLPTVIGTGLGATGFFAFTLREAGPEGQEQTYASTYTFVVSMLMALLAATDVTRYFFQKIPASVRNATPIGLSFFFAVEAFSLMGVVDPHMPAGHNLKRPILSFSVVASVLGFCAMAALKKLHFRTSLLLPMAVLTVVGWILDSGLGFDIHSPAPRLTPGSAYPRFRLFFDASMLDLGTLVRPFVALYVICALNIGSVSFAVASLGGLLEEGQENAVVPTGQKKKTYHGVSFPGVTATFLSCAVGSAVAAILGCGPVVTLSESIAGVLSGGRTGLTAVTFGVLALTPIVLAPLVDAIPLFASAPVLLLVGCGMLPLVSQLDFNDVAQALPSFVTIALMPMLFSIDKAIVAGLIAHVTVQVALRLFTAVCGDVDDEKDSSRASEEDFVVAEAKAEEDVEKLLAAS